MKNNQVSPAQIEQLFTFLRQKYVRYYDVQIELVDHFASAIEAMWEENPSMTFQQGIDRVYADFPITGFNNLITEKTAILNKKILSHAWKEVKLYLQFPKIMLTLLLVTVLYLLFSMVAQPMLFAYAIWMIVFFVCIYLVGQFRKVGSRRRKFLVLNALLGSHFFHLGLLFCCAPPQDFIGFGSLSFWPTIALSIFTTFFILFSAGHYKVAGSIFEEWKMQYPQFV